MTIAKNERTEQTLWTQEMLATYYAWGRLDQGHPPIVGTSPEPRNTVDTAYHFGLKYTAMQRAMAYEITCFAHGVQTAWDNFVASDGRSVLRPRDQECTHEREAREWEGCMWCPNCGAQVASLLTHREALTNA